MTSMRFCKEYIEMMEAHGKWSDGSNSVTIQLNLWNYIILIFENNQLFIPNKDNRLEGGYEAVPTRDIHTNQVQFERHWLYILQQYVRPLQELVFTGYFHDVSILPNIRFVFKHISQIYTFSAAKIVDELRCAIQTWRATFPQTAPWQLHVHHQFGIEHTRFILFCDFRWYFMLLVY